MRSFATGVHPCKQDCQAILGALGKRSRPESIIDRDLDGLESALATCRWRSTVATSIVNHSFATPNTTSFQDFKTLKKL